ncbi:ParA family protein [Prauserella halophila]|uniref:ParA family protein n=1 Tax=Prauserella halophila TaxID=185641 RepID=UPI0020A24D0D|nr:ParA family protein [Prauserella halophila]MCP2238639.1 chromosome partitioning protein [Prauserella halophila]
MSTSQQPRSESGGTSAEGSGATAGAPSDPAAGPGYSGAAAADTAPSAAGEGPAAEAADEASADKVKLGPTGRPLREIPEPPELQAHGPATVLAMCNQKGGVGKTTSTINLGAALAEYGRRVLLVDFDPQGALSVGLGVQPHELEQSVYNVIMERSLPVDSVIRDTKLEGIDLLPSNIDLSAAEVQLVAEVGREHTLLRVLHPVIKQYDYVLVDCQPSLGLLTVNALTASDGVIIPLECEFFSLRGVALLIDTIDKVRERLNPKLDISGILATMFDSRTLHSKEVMARVVEAFGDTVFDTVINRTVRFPETTVAGEPITKWAPRSAGAAAYRQLAREVIGR